jgi:type III secretory pathway component EscS
MVRYESLITAMIGALIGAVIGLLIAVAAVEALKDDGLVLGIPVVGIVFVLIAAGNVGRAKAAMSAPMLDSLGGFGGADEVRSAIGRYLDAGATSPGVSPVPTADFDATLKAGAELI